MQDGGAGADHRRAARWSAGAGQRDQPEAAAIKGIVSKVAGQANVLVVPDLEAGNMLAKSLTFLAGADARRHRAWCARADHADQPGGSLLTRLASCAVAALVAEARRKATAVAGD